MRIVLFLGCAVAVSFAHDWPPPQPAAPTGKPCAPLAVPNAEYDPPIAGFNSIADGGRVEVKCAAGYENQGASWVVCQKGRWITAGWEGTSAAPQCLASCDPPEIDNAVFTPAVAASGQTRHGTRVTVGCAEGFEYVGDTTITCYYGQWTGLKDGKCYMNNQSYCRAPEMMSVVQGIMTDYADPHAASQACNYYFLQILGIRADGLSTLGINPATPAKSYERNAFHVPGMTGSDAVFRCTIVPSNWNMTAPAHFSAGSSYCRVYNEEKEWWAYINKVLYKRGWGAFSFQ